MTSSHLVAYVAVVLLSASADASPDPGETESTEDGAWTYPLERVRISATAFDLTSRPFSTPARHRDISGAVDLSCEHHEGRPCGDGAGSFAEVDTVAGYGPWVEGAVRIRAESATGSPATDLRIDRAHVKAKLGPVALAAGRDVIAVGPAARTQLAWGNHAPPLDHLRVSTSRPLDLLGNKGSTLRAGVLYVVGRLRDPQTFSGNLVTIARGQLDINDGFELGMGQLLQLGGDGARPLGAWGFVTEHVRRGDRSASASDSSNRRIMFDASFRIEALSGARFYYQLVFEDWRKRFHDALRFDADHLAGIELAAIGSRRRYGLVVELQSTGVRSQEHSPRVTGFTHAGRVVGSPLGPDVTSLFARGRIELGKREGELVVWPWVEVARLSSDTYTFVTKGPISLATHGPTEARYRIGGRVRYPVTARVAVEGEAVYERVTSEAFIPGATQDNTGVTITLLWYPGGKLGQWP